MGQRAQRNTCGGDAGGSMSNFDFFLFIVGWIIGNFIFALILWVMDRD